MGITRRQHMKALTAVLGCTCAGLALPADMPLYGTWTGILEAGNVQLTLRLIVDATGVHVISVDQGGAIVAGSDVVIEATQIKVNFKPIRARFEGRLTDDRHMDGLLTQGRTFELRTGGCGTEARTPCGLPKS